MPKPIGQVVLKNGVALAGPELRETRFRTMVLRDDAIVEISDQRSDDLDSDTHDLGGAYVVPGLIDAHVHFDLAAQPAAYSRWTDPRMTLVRSLTCLHNGLIALRQGITSVRDLGSVDTLVLDYAAYVNSGRLVGPRVVAAGKPITITGGHCSQYGRTASGPNDVREAVREQVAMGAHVIKIMASGGISTPGDPSSPQFTAEEIHAAVDEAHRFRRQVAAHAHASAAIQMAVAVGVDTIEHAGFADDETLEMVKSHDRTLVPTVTALNNIGPDKGIAAETVRKSLAARETYRANTGKAIELGVRIAAGTDAGTALNPIGGLVDELDMYCERGMRPIDAIRAATVNAGQLVSPTIGMIEVGYGADLLVLADDPRERLATLRQPVAVIARGRQMSESWLTETIEELVVAVAEEAASSDLER